MKLMKAIYAIITVNFIINVHVIITIHFFILNGFAKIKGHQNNLLR